MAAATGRACAREPPGRDPVRGDRRRAARDRRRGRLCRAGVGRRQPRADVHHDHVLGRPRGALDPVRRRLPLVQPLACDRPRGRRHGRPAGPGAPPVPRAARPLAGRRRAADVHVDRARGRVGRHSEHPRDGGGRLHGRHARRAVGLGSGELDPSRRGVLGLLQPAVAHQRVRDAEPGGRAAAAAGRAAAARPGARHGRGRDGHDRHGHVRRAQSGGALERRRAGHTGHLHRRSEPGL